MPEANTACAGNQLLAADKDELAKLVERCTVFAKVTPEQKMAVVAALQAAGHIVGFLGDGNNDALALRKADVGVSVDSGASVSVHCKPLLCKAAKTCHIQSTQSKLCGNLSFTSKLSPWRQMLQASFLWYDCNLDQSLSEASTRY